MSGGKLKKGETLKVSIQSPEGKSVSGLYFTEKRKHQRTYWTIKSRELKKYGYGNYVAEVRVNGELKEIEYFAITK